METISLRPEEALAVVMKALEGGAIKLTGPSGVLPQPGAEKDAEYLKTLLAELSRPTPIQGT